MWTFFDFLSAPMKRKLFSIPTPALPGNSNDAGQCVPPVSLQLETVKYTKYAKKGVNAQARRHEERKDY
jgi:hypothetical protein